MMLGCSNATGQVLIEKRIYVFKQLCLDQYKIIQDHKTVHLLYLRITSVGYQCHILHQQSVYDLKVYCWTKAFCQNLGFGLLHASQTDWYRICIKISFNLQRCCLRQLPQWALNILLNIYQFHFYSNILRAVQVHNKI